MSLYGDSHRALHKQFDSERIANQPPAGSRASVIVRSGLTNASSLGSA